MPFRGAVLENTHFGKGPPRKRRPDQEADDTVGLGWACWLHRRSPVFGEKSFTAIAEQIRSVELKTGLIELRRPAWLCDHDSY